MGGVSLLRLLVPIDFSDTAAAAVKYAVALADGFGAEIHLLYVDEQPLEWQGVPEMALVSSPADDAARARRAEAELAGLLTREERERYRAVVATARGAPAAAIVTYAAAHDVDLIVMGTHGRGAVAHLLIGSVAERVVRRAPCPVLTIPRRGHDFVTI
ncbi:MAG: universal stress protein [Vicinamibacterales bacterium]